MTGTGERPFRAVVYLPGHAEGGVLVKQRILSAHTEAGLHRLLSAYVREGYRVKAYEVLQLPLDLPRGDTR